MRTPKSSLLLFAALFGFTLPSPAGVIVDDTWASGAYTNWNLPIQSPWYYNSSTTNLYMGVQPGALILTNFDESNLTLVTGTRYFWTYFTSNAPDLTVSGLSYTNQFSGATNIIYGYPVEIKPGEMITATLKFSPSGVIVDSGTKGLRFGLLEYGTNTPGGRAARSTANISKSGTNVTGYFLEIPLFVNLTNNNMFSFRVRTNLNGLGPDSGDPLGKTSVYQGLGGGPNFTNATGFVADTDYTLQFSVSRYATANQVSADLTGMINGFGAANVSRSYLDTSGSNYFQFDAFVMRVDTSSLVADRLVLKEFKVETSALPPIIIAGVKPTADSFQLSWNSISGQKYQIQSTDSLTPSAWASNDTVVATGTTSTWAASGLTGVPSRLYRVVNTP
jgi:hypothetical protein